MEILFVIVFMLIVIAVIVLIDYYRITHLRNCPCCGHRMSLHHKVNTSDYQSVYYVFYCPHCKTYHKVPFEDLLAPEKP